MLSGEIEGQAVQERSHAEEEREEHPSEDGGTALSDAAELPAPELPTVMLTDVSAIEASGQRARLAEDRLAEVLKAYRQLKSDQETQRERMTRALERRFEGRHERLLVKFIDVLDCFDRALEAAEQTYAGAPLIEGLILVRTQLLQTLRDEGLDRIPVLGLPFDPHVSEAMGTAAVDDPDQHQIVVKEYQRGYRIKARVVRPSRVVVGECAGVSSNSLPTVADAVSPAEGASARHPAEDSAPGEPDSRVSEEPDMGTAISVTPLTEEDGAPTIEEIIARAEAGEARSDGNSHADEQKPDGTNPEDQWK